MGKKNAVTSVKRYPVGWNTSLRLRRLRFRYIQLQKPNVFCITRVVNKILRLISTMSLRSRCCLNFEQLIWQNRTF